MASFATPEDVEAVWRPLSAEEQAAASKWLSFASVLIRTRVPSVDDRIADGTLDAEIVELVAVSMVKRIMQNPTGTRQSSETLGSWSYSATYSELVASGVLSLSPEELALLRPARSGAFSITPHLSRQEPCPVAYRL